jgi:hypothetical protein
MLMRGCVEFYHIQKGLAAKQNLKTRTSCIATNFDINRPNSGDTTARMESGTDYQVKALLRKGSQIRSTQNSDNGSRNGNGTKPTAINSRLVLSVRFWSLSTYRTVRVSNSCTDQQIFLFSKMFILYKTPTQLSGKDGRLTFNCNNFTQMHIRPP